MISSNQNYVMGQGWQGKFKIHVNTDHPYHLCWRSEYHRHNAVQFITFRTALELEQYCDELDRDFCDYEPMKYAEGTAPEKMELEREKGYNGE